VPTYDYQCRSCDRVTEVIHAMSEDGPSVCEHCGGPLRRVLFPAGIIFKGSGFYRTDSRSGTDQTTSTPSKPTGSTPAASGSTASDGGSSTASSTSTTSGSSSSD